MFLRESIAANSREGKFQFRLRQYRDEPKKDTKKEIVIAIPVTADSGDDIAEWLRVGSSVNIVFGGTCGTTSQNRL
jgi:hypothetical protein